MISKNGFFVSDVEKGIVSKYINGGGVKEVGCFFAILNGEVGELNGWSSSEVIDELKEFGLFPEIVLTFDEAVRTAYSFSDVIGDYVWGVSDMSSVKMTKEKTVRTFTVEVTKKVVEDENIRIEIQEHNKRGEWELAEFLFDSHCIVKKVEVAKKVEGYFIEIKHGEKLVVRWFGSYSISRWVSASGLHQPYGNHIWKVGDDMMDIDRCVEVG